MNKEDILKQVSFDLNKAKAIHEWLTQDNQPTTLPPIGVTQPVSIHYDENGDPDGIRVCALDEDFLVALHDEFDGEDVTFDKAKTVSLFTDKQVYLYYYYLDDIVRLMEEAGGDPLDDVWYWTKTPSAISANGQLFFNGTNGYLGYSSRYNSLRVRVALALNTEKL
jgi:hypothetical protein